MLYGASVLYAWYLFIYWLISFFWIPSPPHGPGPALDIISVFCFGLYLNVVNIWFVTARTASLPGRRIVQHGRAVFCWAVLIISLKWDAHLTQWPRSFPLTLVLAWGYTHIYSGCEESLRGWKTKGQLSRTLLCAHAGICHCLVCRDVPTSLLRVYCSEPLAHTMLGKKKWQTFVKYSFHKAAIVEWS